jgi:hypothetical protein
MDPAPGLFKPGAGFLRDKAGEWAACLRREAGPFGTSAHSTANGHRSGCAARCAIKPESGRRQPACLNAGRVKNIQKDLARLRKFVEFAKTSVKCIQLHGIIKAVQHVQPKECMRKA